MRPPSDALDLSPYDAIVLLSFGGPEGHDEVMPFLRRVTEGRDIPEERLEEVAGHYHQRGGTSPINAQNRAMVDALADELARRGVDLPVRLGNRNSQPFLTDCLRGLAGAGARRVLVVLTSAYSSYSSCRQYRENLADAAATLAEEGLHLEVDKLEPWHGLAGFVDTSARHVLAALDGRGGDRTRILGVTHSIPTAMAEASGPPDLPDLYVDQHRRVLAAIDEQVAAAGIETSPAELVYCSRSGPPHQPWLDPDVSDRIAELAIQGVSTVVLVPIGFVSDHMEVVSDLDTDAVAAGQRAGVEVIRVPTVGTDPRIVADLVALMADRAALGRGEQRPPRTVLPGDHRPAVCAPGCCRNLRGDRPALCGADS